MNNHGVSDFLEFGKSGERHTSVAPHGWTGQTSRCPKSSECKMLAAHINNVIDTDMCFHHSGYFINMHNQFLISVQFQSLYIFSQLIKSLIHLTFKYYFPK